MWNFRTPVEEKEIQEEITKNDLLARVLGKGQLR